MPINWSASSRSLQPSCFNRLFLLANCTYVRPLGKLQFHIWRKIWYHTDSVWYHIRVYLGFKSCPSSLEIVVTGVPARYMRTFSGSMSVLQVRTILLLDALQLLMLFLGTFTLFGTRTFSLNNVLLFVFLHIIKILILFYTVLSIYVSSHRIKVNIIPQIEWLLSKWYRSRCSVFVSLLVVSL
jgi:fumarate reductase subunit D